MWGRSACVHISPSLHPSPASSCRGGEWAGLGGGRACGAWRRGCSTLLPPRSCLPGSSRSPLSYDIAGFGAPWEESGPFTLLATAVAPFKDGKHGHECGLNKPSPKYPLLTSETPSRVVGEASPQELS